MLGFCLFTIPISTLEIPTWNHVLEYDFKIKGYSGFTGNVRSVNNVRSFDCFPSFMVVIESDSAVFLAVWFLE